MLYTRIVCRRHKDAKNLCRNKRIFVPDLYIFFSFIVALATVLVLLYWDVINRVFVLA